MPVSQQLHSGYVPGLMGAYLQLKSGFMLTSNSTAIPFIVQTDTNLGEELCLNPCSGISMYSLAVEHCYSYILFQTAVQVFNPHVAPHLPHIPQYISISSEMTQELNDMCKYAYIMCCTPLILLHIF